MASTAELIIQIQGQNDVSKVLKNVDNDVSGLGKTMQTAGAVASGFLAANAVQAGIGALTGFIGSSITAIRESITVNAQLDAVLRSTGSVAGVTAESVRTMGASLEKMSLFEDEAIISSSNLLLTFTKVGKEVFPQAQQAILDMSQAMGMDLQSATTMVGKALNDPIAGITALTRAGVQFTDEQKEMIKGMVEAGDTAGAQALILGELETQFGGSAKAASDAAGSSEVYKDRMNELQETIGTKMLPINEKLMEAKIALIDLLTTKVIPVIEELYVKHWPAISQAIGDVVTFIQTNWPLIQPIIEFAAEFMRVKIEGMIQALQGFVEVVTGVIAFVDAIFHGEWLAAWEALQQIAAGILDLLIGNIKMTFGSIPGIIGGFAGEAAASAAGFAESIFNAIKGVLEGLGGWMLQVGKDAVTELWNGFSSFDLGGEISRFVQRAIPGSIRSLLGIGSPSRVMFDIGRFIVQGLFNGIMERLPSLASAAAAIKDVIWDAASGAGGAVSSALGAVGGAIGSVGGAIGGFFGGGGGGGGRSGASWESLLEQMWPANSIAQARRIIGAESGGNPNAVSPPNTNGTVDTGLFQVNSIHGHSISNLKDPAYNIAAALAIYRRAGNSWQPWSTAPALGLYHQGTNFVPRTGPYILERGEAVIPANENSRGITVNINGPVYARDRDEVNRLGGDVGFTLQAAMATRGIR